METNSDQSAFPVEVHEGVFLNPGLTKREYFAAMAMQGMCANTRSVDINTALEIPDNVAKWSVFFADSLISELNKQR